MGQPALWRRCVVNVSSFIVIVLMVAVGATTIWLRIRNHDHPPPRYYATILNADLNRPSPDGDKMVSTSFVLSLGVAAPPGSLLTGGGYCLDRGTAVQVSHGGKTLARAVVAGWEAVCASWWMPPGNARWTRVVAHGSNITASDALPTDALRGVRVLDVSLRAADGKTAAWCGARQAGDDDKAADAICTTRVRT